MMPAVILTLSNAKGKNPRILYTGHRMFLRGASEIRGFFGCASE
jgi:hypothetical protein